MARHAIKNLTNRNNQLLFPLSAIPEPRKEKAGGERVFLYRKRKILLISDFRQQFRQESVPIQAVSFYNGLQGLEEAVAADTFPGLRVIAFKNLFRGFKAADDVQNGHLKGNRGEIFFFRHGPEFSGSGGKEFPASQFFRNLEVFDTRVMRKIGGKHGLIPT